jgi:hypothetical protein
MTKRHHPGRWLLIASFATLPLVLLASRALADELPDDCSQAQIPDRPAAGNVSGQKFVAQDVSLSNINHPSIGGIPYDEYDLFMHSRDKNGDDIQLIVDTLVPEGELPDGKTFRHLPTDNGSKQPAAGPGAQAIPNWSIEYDVDNVNVDATSDIASIRLEFDKRTQTTLTGRIFFCAPTVKGSYVAGKFEIDISQ